MFTLEIFYFCYDSWARTRAKLKADLYFLKLIMQKVSYIPLKNILADNPLPRMSKKVEFLITEEAVSSRFLINLFWHQLGMSKLPWLHSLIKHNVAAKHWSSKPMTSNELWLELRIKNIRILASIPDALWDKCESSIKFTPCKTILCLEFKCKDLHLKWHLCTLIWTYPLANEICQRYDR